MTDEYTLVQKAADFLNKPLVWSEDMESIRYHLSELLTRIELNKPLDVVVEDLCEAILSDTANNR